MSTRGTLFDAGKASGKSDADLRARPDRLPTGGESSMRILLEAHDYAEELSRDRWEFAVEMAALENCGLTRSGIRWLVCKGLVDHAREIRPQKGQVRAFRPTGSLTLYSRTCFVLTESGVSLARSLDSATEEQRDQPARDKSSAKPIAPPPAGAGGTPVDRDPLETAKPEWDPMRQELRINGCVVKRFKVPAPNQELILAAFQEEGWPVRIDDPLPPHPELDTKRRLHDTINALNRRQIAPLLRFLGDGKGRGILWETAANRQ